MKRTIKILLVVTVALALVSTAAFAKSKKSDEGRFQLGFGGFISTNNILGLIENVRMNDAIQSSGTLPAEFSGLTDINVAMQRAIMVANILGGMEYGFKTRILWKILIAEADLVLTPFNGSYNGRLDFTVNTGVGIRAPFWIMPYFVAGPMFTFSFYPDEFTAVESWKSNYAGFQNFLFRPGLNTRVGLDFKFKKFSIGAYYNYAIKDFQEFTLWYEDLVAKLDSGDTAAAQAQAAGMVFGAQSKFGVSMTWYLF
jgi:hypothetical protein